MTLRVLTLRIILVRYFVKCLFSVFFFFSFYDLTKVKSFEEEHTDKWPFSSYQEACLTWVSAVDVNFDKPGRGSVCPFLLCKVALLHYTPWERSMHVHAQSYPILCDPLDCSLPGSSAHGVLQARILECVAFSYCRGSSYPRDWTHISCIGR